MYEDKVKSYIYELKKDNITMDNEKKICYDLINNINNISTEMLLIIAIPKIDILSSYYSKLTIQYEKSEYITKMINTIDNILKIYVDNMDNKNLLNFLKHMFYQLIIKFQSILYNCKGINNIGINQFLIDITYIEEYIFEILKKNNNNKNNNNKISKIIIDKFTEIKNIIKILRINDIKYAKELFYQLFKYENNEEEFNKILHIKIDNGFHFFKKFNK